MSRLNGVMRLLLPLLAALLCIVPALSQSPLPADGSFRPWLTTRVAAHPTGNTAYIVDGERFIRAVDRMSGRELPNMQPADLAPQMVEDLSVSAYNDHVYALTLTRNEIGWYERSYLVVLSGDLQLLYNVSLFDVLSPRVALGDEFFAVMAGKGGAVYVPRRLFNGTVLMHVLMDGKQIDVWVAPVPTTWDNEYGVALGYDGFLYMQTFTYNRGTPQLLYVCNTGGLLVATLSPNSSTPYWGFQGSIAVAHSGNIAISWGYGVNLYDTRGNTIQSFQYLTPLFRYNGFASLSFDASDRLLAVDYSSELGVQVISQASGDLLTSWSNGIPTLRSVRDVQYDDFSRSLLLIQPQMSDTPVIRVDGDRGFLVQEYPVAERFQQECVPTASTVGEMSGDIYTLHACNQYYIGASVVLVVTTQAGQLRRQVTLYGWMRNYLWDEMVAAEDKQLLYVVYGNSYFKPASINRVMAFSFNGTNVFNATDDKIGDIGSYRTHMLRVGTDQLAVVDSTNDRIALLDASTGAFFGNITAPNGTVVLTAAYDGKYWYRSEARSVDRFNTYTLVLVKYSEDYQSELARYDMANAGQMYALVWTINIDKDGKRLYAIKGGMSSQDGTVMYWNLQRRDDETVDQAAAEVAVQPSGVRVLPLASSVSRRTARDSLRAAESVSVPAFEQSVQAASEQAASVRKVSQDILLDKSVPEWLRRARARYNTRM